jgi:Holliday junction resolvase RusA-like endonuclease
MAVQPSTETRAQLLRKAEAKWELIDSPRRAKSMEIASEYPAPVKRGRGRPPCRSALFTLPMPPSTNALWFNAPGRGRVKTDAYRAWLKDAGWAIRAARIENIPGRVAISVRAGLPTRTRDLDNLLKPTFDALVSFSVIGDDKDVVRLTASSAVDVPEGTVEIHVKQFPHPAYQQRSAAA